MQLAPRPETYPQIANALRFFKFASAVTGVMLFGLYIISGIRWFLHSDIFLFGSEGLVRLQQLPPAGLEVDFAPSGINFTIIFLIAHGWFYVVYLIAVFLLWSRMRWEFWKFLALAAAGCVVVVSFVCERYAVRATEKLLAAHPDTVATDQEIR